MKVNIIGTGMGTVETMTTSAVDALKRSGLIVGAPRLIESLPETNAKTIPLIRASEIAQAIDECNAQEASVIVSGDTGFYSMANSLYDKLEGHDVETIPGISSACYFCAKLHTTWQDALMLSAHGRNCNFVGQIRTNKKVFLLTGGATKAHDVCAQLARANLGYVTVHAGEWLGYPQERILSGTAEELAEMKFADLTVLLVENPNPMVQEALAPSIPDEDFQRGSVPMTKREVRVLAISKLQAREDSLIWDVGAGTGSVSVECALHARKGRVFAIERKDEAVELIHANAEKFGCGNITVVEGLAPDALEGLPAPDCVFVGGSGGNLNQIIRCILSANPQARIVIAAVTVQTLAEATQCLADFNLEDPEVVQVSIAKGKQAGSYTLMNAQNPVFLISGKGRE